MNLEIVKFDKQFEHLVFEITELLHDAYAGLAAAGMNSTREQSPQTTLARLTKGVSFLGLLDSKVVATITVVDSPSEDLVSWLKRPGLFFFTQFAVSPEYHRNGFGGQVLKHAESFAKQEGAEALALDTSEKATDLVNWYKRQGYRIVDYCQLPETSYRSVVMSKRLDQ